MTTLVPCHCPYCGESIDLAFDAVADDSAGTQDYVEDCPVCCRPIQVRARVAEGGEAMLALARDDES